jgi:hypothetical protein
MHLDFPAVINPMCILSMRNEIRSPEREFNPNDKSVT